MSQRIAHKIATAYAPPPEYDSPREIIPLLKERGELGFLLGDPVGRCGPRQPVLGPHLFHCRKTSPALAKVGTQ